MNSTDFMSSRPSTSSRSESIPNLKIRFVKIDQGIPNIIYEENLTNSSTQTEMDTSSQLNVIISKSKFELDKKSLQKEFMFKENCIERIAFFKNYFET